jgi:hypothetical protein
MSVFSTTSFTKGASPGPLVDAGEILQVRDDPGDPVRADPEGVDDLGHVVAQLLVADAALAPAVIGGGMLGQNGLAELPDLFQERDVVGDEAVGVVDLVDDPRHDLPQGGQLVRLDHLLQAGVGLLEDSLFLGDVLPDAHDMADRPLGSPDEAAELGEPAVGPVLGPEPELAAAHALRTDPQVAASHDGPVVGVDVIEEEGGVFQELVGPEAGEFLHGTRDVGDLLLFPARRGEGDDGQRLQDDGEALGGLGQPRLRVPSRQGRAEGAGHHVEGLHLHVGPPSVLSASRRSR